ncbi:hypothetical protein [Butyrivibrio fibrisolvens]|uniref:hypothetical protein n=1 Tax=Butyrivibrio fibrisolvens TaxID=831 RepID=UPI0011B1F093|nr:hypothetical protein [Butyrivibrio fibrisolvens]
MDNNYMKLRRYAVEMLDQNKIQGYLAYDGDKSIGWCNAADIESYAGFTEIARENEQAVMRKVL